MRENRMIHLSGQWAEEASVRFAYGKLATLDTDLEICLQEDPFMEEQSWRIEPDSTASLVKIAVPDRAGTMYALLDLYDLLRRGQEIRPTTVTPYLKNRGIKFNIPLDARTPSYSDAATSAVKNIANMWDFGFWTDFLDRMAENKYNVLSLWNLCPFPSMVRIPEFPNLYLDDVKVSAHAFHAEMSGKNIFDEDHRRNLYTVKKIGIDEKIAFWQAVMEYAASRCVRIFLFTWNLFAYGTEDSGYDITEDLDNPVTRDYIYYGTKALLDTYPLLAGIGVTAGENMAYNGKPEEGEVPFGMTDVGYLSETYGRACRDYLAEHPDRKFTFIHRMMMARYDKIMNAYADYPGEFEISFKYSQAHMYSSTNPGFIREFLKEKDPSLKIWLTVRNDDYYMCRWGSPDFAREYLKGMPVSCMEGFYMGPDGFTWGRDYMTAGEQRHPLVMEKMWYMFRIWGMLSYNPQLDNPFFEEELRLRFRLGTAQAAHLYRAWEEASRIIPEFDCIHWHDFDFQWYPEGCCMYLHKPIDKLVFANIYEFMECRALPFSEYVSVRDYVTARLEGRIPEGITPVDMIRSVRRHIQTAQEELAGVPDNADKDFVGIADNTNEELAGVADNANEDLARVPDNADEELARTVADIRDQCLLGSYYILKEEAAIALEMARQLRHKKTSGAIRSDGMSGSFEMFDPSEMFTPSEMLTSSETLTPSVLLTSSEMLTPSVLKDHAVRLLQEAIPYWKAYSRNIRSRYLPQVLGRLCAKVDISDFDETAELDILLAQEDL